MKVSLHTPKMGVNIKSPKMNVKFGVQGIGTGGVRQVDWGDVEPTDPNILIWIDTYVSPITGTQLITYDNLEFMTADNEAFILAEEVINTLLTSDGKEFIDANNRNFILREEI